MTKYNINANIIRLIESLYDKAQTTVLFNGSAGDWFRTTAGERKRCLLSPTPFNISLERIKYGTLDDHAGSVSIRFADDITVNAKGGEEASVLVDRLDTTTTRYTMEVGPDKTTLMTNNPNGFQREIKLKCQRLEAVENYDCLFEICKIAVFPLAFIAG